MQQSRMMAAMAVNARATGTQVWPWSRYDLNFIKESDALVWFGQWVPN
jgi:hypothetical protein